MQFLDTLEIIKTDDTVLLSYDPNFIFHNVTQWGNDKFWFKNYVKKCLMVMF